MAPIRGFIAPRQASPGGSPRPHRSPAPGRPGRIRRAAHPGRRAAAATPGRRRSPAGRLLGSVLHDRLRAPTSIQFSPDGRVFVAERAGLIKVFDSLGDPTPTVVADLHAKVLARHLGRPPRAAGLDRAAAAVHPARRPERPRLLRPRRHQVGTPLPQPPHLGLGLQPHRRPDPGQRRCRHGGRSHLLPARPPGRRPGRRCPSCPVDPVRACCRTIRQTISGALYGDRLGKYLDARRRMRSGLEQSP
jgi:hypothetical protein